MKIAAIIAEYNPFHNGHAYHILKTRSLGYSHIVAIMSGNTVQRGDIAVLDAHARAEAAIKGGANLVIELPPPYSCASAADFAISGVDIAKRLGAVSALSFGSECGDTDALISCAGAMEDVDGNKIKAAIAAGLTYPAAIAATMEKSGELLQGANNTLAIEYIKALKGSGIEPITVKRTTPHDHDLCFGSFASASHIRSLLKNNEDASRFIPDTCSESVCFSDRSFIEAIEKPILFRLSAMTPEEIKAAPYMSDGVGERIARNVMSCSSLSELYSKAKTRNVTHARVRRAILLAALGVKAEDMSAPPPYARVLAADKNGLEILSSCKLSASIPISTSLKELSKASEHALRCATLTELVSKLRHMASYSREGYVSEYSRKAIIRG